jgi:hypothetical protein
VRMSPRSIEVATEFSNLFVALTPLSSFDFAASLRMTAGRKKKPGSNFDPGFQILPRRCRSGGSPVPFQ